MTVFVVSPDLREAYFGSLDRAFEGFTFIDESAAHLIHAHAGGGHAGVGGHGTGVGHTGGVGGGIGGGLGHRIGGGGRGAGLLHR